MAGNARKSTIVKITMNFFMFTFLLYDIRYKKPSAQST
jgi:hypothetical protein